MIKKTTNNLEEIHRRQTVAQLKRAGTQIRKEELERIRMSASILLPRAKNIYGAIKGKDSMLKRGLENIRKIDETETEEEESRQVLQGLVDFVEDMGTIALVQPEVEGLVKTTNDIIVQLENQGVHFSFPKFTSYPGITACKFNLEGIIGFLQGISEVRMKG